MAPLSIMEHLNAFEDVLYRIFTSGVVQMIDKVTLECHKVNKKARE